VKLTENKFLLDTSIIEIASVNSTTRDITMLVHILDEPNGNNLQFNEEYTNLCMNTLIDKPVVCEYYPTQNDFGDHAVFYSEDGIELRTIAVGTINKVWIDNYIVNNETKRALFANATIWAYKYPQIMECIEELNSLNILKTSVEVEVMTYLYNSDVRIAKEYTYLANCILSPLVMPADSNAGVINVFQREVASAIKESSLEKGGRDVSDVEFNNGKEIKFHFEANDLSHDDIREQLWASFNDQKDDGGYTIYEYWIAEVFIDYVIVCDWNDGKYYKFNYTVENNTVSVDKESKVEVVSTWIEVDTPEVATLQEEIAQKDSIITELNAQIEQLNAELVTKDQALAMNQTEANEKIIKLGENIVSLQEQVASLLPIKEAHEAKLAELAEQEKAIQRANLKQYALNSKVIAEKDFEDVEELKIALASLDEVKIKSYIADKYVEKAKLELNSTETPVVVNVTPPEDLVVGNVASKYGF
jgi:hypothetical protein